MGGFALEPSGIFRPKLIIPSSPIIPTPQIEELFDTLDRKIKDAIGALINKPIRERIAVLMSGSLTNYASKSLADLLFGKTAYAGETTIYAGLWAAAIDDTFNGATASEAAYGSYARMTLTNNTTNFAAGTGTAAYTKTFPSDAVHSWATSTATGTNNTETFLGFLNGNAGTSADKGVAWCSVTSTLINSGDTPQLAQNAVTAVTD
jgi:hypothetical protein